jgi:hypothetical protein
MTVRDRARVGDAFDGVRIGAVERAQARAMMSTAEAIVESLFAVHQRAKSLLSRGFSRVVASA